MGSHVLSKNEPAILKKRETHANDDYLTAPSAIPLIMYFCANM